MKKLVIYVHGKGGNINEANHYKSLFIEYDVIGFDYKAQTPWEAKIEFTLFFDSIKEKYDEIILIANSIGAFLAMYGFFEKKISKAFFISPIVDMETLILDMMRDLNIKENELKNKKEITTSFGETISWDYLCYLRNNPMIWKIPTYILYGEYDKLTSYNTIYKFKEKINASLTITKSEHWFHTDEQMKSINNWIKKIIQ